MDESGKEDTSPSSDTTNSAGVDENPSDLSRTIARNGILSRRRERGVNFIRQRSPSRRR